jgi:hypothetical protein
MTGLDYTTSTPFGVGVDGWVVLRKLRPTATHDVALRATREAMATTTSRFAAREETKRRQTLAGFKIHCVP